LQLFEELKRRNVFRVAIGYIVSCWLLAQVADMVLDVIGAPGWILQTIVLVLALGFPVVVFFSWVYEVTPEGIKRESEIDRSQSITHVTARKLDRAIIGVLIIALAYFVWESRFGHEPQVIEPDADQATTAAPAVQPETVASPAAETTSDAMARENSIAVLPFVNMSSDPEQDYFSDGLSEELLNALAKNPELMVAARTSSFAFKGQQLEISDIAQRLKVAHVLEGSVRTAGDQVRITAQLIDATEGYHLWSETYDRKLEDVFSLQQEIAAKITAALLPRIIKTDGAAPPAMATEKGHGYKPPAQVFQQYLLARSHYYRQTESGREKALEIMTPLVRENPDYAEAQAFYALVTFESSARTGGDIPWITAEARARKAVERALQLNPGTAEAYLVRGRIAERSRDILSAIAAYEQAIKINPSYSDAYVSLAQAAMMAGQTDRAWETLDLARSLDPFSPQMLATSAHIGTLYQRPEMAEEAMAVLWEIEPESASDLQIHLYSDLSQDGRALIQLEQHRKRFQDSERIRHRLGVYYARLGMTKEAAEISPWARMILAAQGGQNDVALALADELAADRDDPHDRADVYWQTYFAMGDNDKALTVLSDLWYGYAEEQVGPRMDTWDCMIFGVLLVRAGRREEAAPVLEMLQRETRLTLHQWWGTGLMQAWSLFVQGDVDGAMRILQGLADQKRFDDEYGKPFESYPGLEEHPEFPSLVAKFRAWQKQQYELYQSLKAQ
jgi:TolB-like protein